MVVAYERTPADADRFEYCGLIVRKANDAGFRAGSPETSLLPQFCGASISLGAGEVVVGYDHTHTAASDPELSEDDIELAEDLRRESFVLSTANGSGQQYSPSRNRRTNLGCPF